MSSCVGSSLSLVSSQGFRESSDGVTDSRRYSTGLFRLDELRDDTSYKTETDQVDGTVTIELFLCLVEARWRGKQAVDGDLGDLKRRVMTRLHATRGIFVSMAGFRPEAVDEWRMAKENKLVFVDGQDLALILEGRIAMVDALVAEIHAAGKDGEPYLRLATML